MNNLYGIADVQIKIFNDDWNSVSRAVSDFCAKYNGNITDLQFQNGFSGGVKVMVVYREVFNSLAAIELAENYGSLNLLQAYIMRQTHCGTQTAEDIAYRITDYLDDLINAYIPLRSGV